MTSLLKKLGFNHLSGHTGRGPGGSRFVNIIIDPRDGIQRLNPEMVDEALTLHMHFFSRAAHWNKEYSEKHPLYMIVQSDDPKTFSYGGDLGFFYRQILQSLENKTGPTKDLLLYATQCAEVVYNFSSALPERHVLPVSLVRGDAMGGGFEIALSTPVAVMETDAALKFPEAMFGMFPGMGAYSFLARQVSRENLDDLIMRKKKISPAEYRDMIADPVLKNAVILAKPGEGEDVLYEAIASGQVQDTIKSILAAYPENRALPAFDWAHSIEGRDYSKEPTREESLEILQGIHNNLSSQIAALPQGRPCFMELVTISKIWACSGVATAHEGNMKWLKRIAEQAYKKPGAEPSP
jgi:enoyl-CoA hydratase/carnithine racemase